MRKIDKHQKEGVKLGANKSEINDIDCYKSNQDSAPSPPHISKLQTQKLKLWDAEFPKEVGAADYVFTK